MKINYCYLNFYLFWILFHFSLRQIQFPKLRPKKYDKNNFFKIYFNFYFNFDLFLFLF